MNLIYGLIMLAMAAVRLPSRGRAMGKSPLFLGSWVIGQVYVLACLVISVFGISLLIGSLPPMF